jgi:hypothetical protein
MSDQKTNPTSTNETIKFFFTHAFLMNTLLNNNGKLTKNDFKNLLFILYNYNAPSPIVKYQKAVSDFSILDISLKQFLKKKVGNAKIVFNEGLEYGYKVDIKKYNTFNKLIENPNYSNTKIKNEPQYPTIPIYCKQLKIDIPEKQLIYAGNVVPNSSKIFISSSISEGPTPYTDSKSVTVNFLHIFYTDENNKKRIIQVTEEFNTY